MKRFLLLIAIVAVCIPSAVFADDFQGTVHMTVTDGKKSLTIDYQIKPGFVRTNTITGKGETATVIMDTTKSTMTYLMPKQKMYVTQPMPAMATPVHNPDKAMASNRPLIETGISETILGYKCTKYTAPSENGNAVETWVCTDLGNFSGFGGGMGPGGSHSQWSQEWSNVIQGQGFFPLKVIVRDSSGNEKTHMEVTSIEKGALADSVFAPPADYTAFAMPGMGAMIGNGYSHP